jgi:predicted DNA-binding transcriptional regulator AlpA
MKKPTQNALVNPLASLLAVMTPEQTQLVNFLIGATAGNAAPSVRESEPEAYTVNEFCRAYRLSRATFYKLKSEGKAPRCRSLGGHGKLIISRAAAQEWLHADGGGDASTSWMGTSGNWDTAANWGSGAPGTGQNAVVNGTAGSPDTVTFNNAGSETANALTMTNGTLAIDSGSLSLAAASALDGVSDSFAWMALAA